MKHKGKWSFRVTGWRCSEAESIHNRQTHTHTSGGGESLLAPSDQNKLLRLWFIWLLTVCSDPSENEKQINNDKQRTELFGTYPFIHLKQDYYRTTILLVHKHQLSLLYLICIFLAIHDLKYKYSCTELLTLMVEGDDSTGWCKAKYLLLWSKETLTSCFYSVCFDAPEPFHLLHRSCKS